MDLSASLLDVALDNPALVVAGVVRDDDQRAANIGMELLEKVHKTDAVHSAGEAAELHVSTRAACADGRGTAPRPHPQSKSPPPDDALWPASRETSHPGTASSFRDRACSSCKSVVAGSAPNARAGGSLHSCS